MIQSFWTRVLSAALAVAPLGAQSPATAAAHTPPTAADAVRRSLPLLQSSAETWFARRSCSSCHHQALGTMAVAVARESGFAVDSARLQFQAQRSLAASPGWLERYVTLEASINESIGQSYRAVGLAAGGYPASPVTDAVVHLVAAQQHVSGKWGSGSHRPPHEDSEFTGTALSLRTLQLYTPPARREEMAQRVARARAWLQQATPDDTEDQVMQLLGLAWSGQADALEPYVQALRETQRADGGWSQVPTRESDAYATGQVLVALLQAGRVSPSDPALRRGFQFLQETQLADGSWHVRTRRTAGEGLPYFESGYPHGRDQFISYAGAAWATMALSLAQRDEVSVALMGPVSPSFAVRADTLAASGLTPLMHVALTGSADELSAMLRTGVNVNERSAAGTTALMCAAHDSAKVRLLLSAGADPNAVTRSGHSALLLAAATDGASPSARLLLEAGASVDQAAARSNHPGLAALGRTMARGDTLLAAELLRRGAQIDGPVKAEVTPLLNVVFHGDGASADWLLRHGATPDGVDERGETPLMIAAMDGRTDAVRVLLQHGATVDRLDRDGYAALHFAAESPDRGSLALVQLLLDAGADQTRTTRTGETPATLATRWRKQYMAELLSRAP